MAKLIKNKEMAGGIAFSLFSLWLFYEISNFDTTSERYRSLGPTVFPYFLTACLSILSVAMIVRGLREEKSRILSFSIKDSATFQMVLLIILVLGLSFFINEIGFILGGIGFMVLAQIVLGSRKWLILLTVSLAVVGIIYVLFAALLRVPLPEGIFTI